MSDPYKVLQVDPEAEDEVIAAAYRRLARKYHPDTASAPDAVARMAAINEAWGRIGDPARRAAFDRERAELGMPAAAPGGQGASPAGPPPGTPAGSVVTFGRYAGWSLEQIAHVDLEYVEWLDRMPIGRPYRDEIDAILRRTGRRGAAETEAAERRGLFRRR